MGTWIEILVERPVKPVRQVVPLVGTWIEMCLYIFFMRIRKVVPLVGTWIEIMILYRLSTGAIVVPLVGTWIEIEGKGIPVEWKRSFPLWERGLKFYYGRAAARVYGRSPCGNVD